MTQPKIIGDQIDQSTLDADNFLPSQTGNNGKVLSTNGSAISWQTASGGASFPIGAVTVGPSAPTDGGTWLECNGQSVSQSTYSSLYSSIGHTFLNYTFERKAAWASANRTSSKCVWDGTNWIGINSASTAVRKSNDNGTTWTSATNLPGAVTTPNVMVNPSTGKIFVWSTTTCYQSTNSGTSWSTVTLPAALLQLGFNGNNIVGLVNGTTVYTSSDDGVNWTTNAGAWPISIYPDDITWSGSKWNAVNVAVGSSNAVLGYFTSTVSSGASGWSISYPTTMPGGNSSVSIIIKPGSNVMIGNLFNAVIRFTTDATATASTILSFPYSAAVTMWTGKHFLTSASGYGRYIAVTDTGLVNQDFFTQGSGVTFGNQFTWGPTWGSNTKYSTNFTTNTVMTLFAQAIGATGAAADVYLSVISPTINTSTNFNVPNYIQTGNFPAGNKSWIKAL